MGKKENIQHKSAKLGKTQNLGGTTFINYLLDWNFNRQEFPMISIAKCKALLNKNGNNYTNIPENKMMLAFYLAAPEVENDRRSINVIAAMRRAKKEGRWMATAPMGYKNARDESGKAIIIPGPQADLVREVFEEFATGTYSMEDLRLRMRKKGLKCSKNQFPAVLKNPVYIGRIYLPAYKDEEATYVNGLHESLISESLFYIKGIKSEIEKNKTRIRNAQKLMLDGDVSIDEYKDIKSDCLKTIENLTVQLSNLSRIEENYLDHLNVGFSLLRGLDKFYDEGDLEVKQLIISSIFPEKLIYEENQYRTARINEVVSRICLNGNQLGANKKGLKRKNLLQPNWVGPPGLEPGTY